MGVIYIGDRAVGKTHLALELANPHNKYVRVLQPNYANLQKLLITEEESTKPTESINLRFLEIQVTLPSGTKDLNLDWVDTPGEMWRERWQTNNPDKWSEFIDSSRKSEGILLILDPYRDLLPADIAGEYSTRQQWCKRFEKWSAFFRYECPKARHIVVCLNKADLFVENIEQEASRLAYHPEGSQMGWRKRHSYVLRKYFRPIHDQIEQVNQETQGTAIQCFVTSIYNRSLLELPWIYLASFLAK